MKVFDIGDRVIYKNQEAEVVAFDKTKVIIMCMGFLMPVEIDELEYVK